MCAQRVQLKTTIDGAQVPLNPYTDCVKNVRQQMPLAGSKLLGTTVLYVGPQTDKYSTGICYTCKATDANSYYWEAVSSGGIPTKVSSDLQFVTETGTSIGTIKATNSGFTLQAGDGAQLELSGEGINDALTLRPGDGGESFIRLQVGQDVANQGSVAAYMSTQNGNITLSPYSFQLSSIRGHILAYTGQAVTIAGTRRISGTSWEQPWQILRIQNNEGYLYGDKILTINSTDLSQKITDLVSSTYLKKALDTASGLTIKNWLNIPSTSRLLIGDSDSSFALQYKGSVRIAGQATANGITIPNTNNNVVIQFSDTTGRFSMSTSELQEAQGGLYRSSVDVSGYNGIKLESNHVFSFAQRDVADNRSILARLNVGATNALLSSPTIRLRSQRPGEQAVQINLLSAKHSITLTASAGATLNDVPIATTADIDTHATLTASSDTLGHIKVDNETITVDENGVATAHAVGHNIFDIFYSMSSKAPAGAMDLSLGTLIASCDTVFPDFWSECLQRRGNAHMFPQFNGNFYYYWSGDNVIGGEGINGDNGNSVCYYKGKIYVLAQGECDGHETPPPQSQEWRQFIVPTEQWDAQKQYSVGDTVLYNGQIWCARSKYVTDGYWYGIGIAPGTTDANGYHHWALYDLPTQIVAPAIRILTESEWQAEVTANGSCGAFVVDQDAKSVRLPKITNIIQPGDVGVFTEAGLPNITGSFSSAKQLNASYNLSAADGAFYSKGQGGASNSIRVPQTITTDYQTVAGFSASNSNPIYGNSTTVQPPAVGAKLYIQVFTSAVPASMAQAGEFINMLEAKADRTELDSYLPLVGGTMTGDILFKSGTGLRMKDANDLLIAHSSGRNADRTCILAGESYNGGASAYLYGSKHATNAGQFSIAANNGTDGKVLNGRPDGSLTWDGVSVLNPTGTVIAFAGNSAPAGYLICNGAAVSRTTYAKLFAVIGTTYGTGDGSTTFNLPNLTNKFIMGSGTAGTTKAAGLPNITGTYCVRSNMGAITSSGTTSGAFYKGTQLSKSNHIGSTSGNSSYYLGLSAKNSNSIYGNSTTVQPPALTMRYYIKY